MASVDENKEGIRGMANPSRYGIERFAYWLMRLTGLGLLAYFVGNAVPMQLLYVLWFCLHWWEVESVRPFHLLSTDLT